MRASKIKIDLTDYDNNIVSSTIGIGIDPATGFLISLPSPAACSDSSIVYAGSCSFYSSAYEAYFSGVTQAQRLIHSTWIERLSEVIVTK